MLGIVVDAFRPPLLLAIRSYLLLMMMSEAGIEYISDRYWATVRSIHVLIAEHHGRY